MRKILIVSLFFSMMLWAGSAFAISLSPEYELISPEPLTGMPTYTAGTNLGYYIWTDDAARTSWHIRWSGGGPDTTFSGFILLDGNEFEEFQTISFENHSGSAADTILGMTDEAAQYFAIANVGEDGIDFTLTQTNTPSFVGFDLFLDYGQDIGESIFFGSDNITAASLGSDGDFKVAAPVPEPGTLLLLGSGLIGLAYLKRRKS